MTIHVTESDLRISTFTALWKQLRDLAGVYPVLTGPHSRADVWHRIVTAAIGIRALYPADPTVTRDIREFLDETPALLPCRTASDCPDFLAAAEGVSDPLHEFMRDFSKNASRVLQHNG